MQAAPVPSSPALQHQSYPPYQAPMVVHPQGLWLPPQQYSGLPRPPLLSYPPPFPGPFPLPTHSSQPPGVTPMGPPIGATTPAVAVGNQLAVGSGMQPELPPGVGMLKIHVNSLNKLPLNNCQSFKMPPELKVAPIQPLNYLLLFTLPPLRPFWTLKLTENGHVHHTIFKDILVQLLKTKISL